MIPLATVGLSRDNPLGEPSWYKANWRSYTCEAVLFEFQYAGELASYEKLGFVNRNYEVRKKDKYLLDFFIRGSVM